MSLDIQFLPLELDKLRECAQEQKDAGHRFVQMLCVTTDNGIDMQYSFAHGGVIENYTIRGVKKGTTVPSITDLYLSAFVYENEAHDLFGVEVVGNVLDFGGKFYAVAENEPMTVITPEQKAAREKAAKIAAAKAAKDAAAPAAKKTADKPVDEAAALEEKLKGLDPEKAAKVKAAFEAKAAKAKQAKAAGGKEGE